MSDRNATTATPGDKKKKAPVHILRDRRGGVPPALLELTRRQATIRKQLTRALQDGPRTVPEIAAASGFTTHEVLWHLMAMKKYGEIVEGEERDGYFEYGLKEKKE
jgi:predicted Rossmann fold nucleotide-binding protein DprA/Smf involved in DNA uptake